MTARTRAWEWMQAALLSANLVWTTLGLGGYRPSTMDVTSLLNGALLAVHFAGSAAGLGGAVHPAGKWLLLFPVYALANVLWVTPVRWLGWHDWLEWAQLVLVFWVVLNGMRAAPVRTALLAVLFALGLADVGLACYQRFADPHWIMLGVAQADQFIGRSSGSFGIPNSLGAFLLLLLPQALALAFLRGTTRLRRLLFAALALALGFGLLLTISRGAWLGRAGARVAGPGFAARRSWARRLGLAAAVGAALAAAGAALYFSMPKVRDRLDALVRDSGELTRPIMWRGAWHIFRDHPILGGGAGAYDVLFEKYRPERYQNEPQWTHNDYLNTLADYGATGFLLFFGACAWIAWRCRHGPLRSPRPGRATVDRRRVVQACAVGLLAFALQLFVDFHLKIPALAMAAAVVAALVVQRSWPLPEIPSLPSASLRLAGLAAALATVAIVPAAVLPFYRSEAARYEPRRAIDRLAAGAVTPEEELSVYARARVAFARATDLAPANAQAWADRSYATALVSHRAPAQTAALGREAESYARRSLALTFAVPEFWLRLGVALDMQGRWVDAGDAFGHALQLAPANSLPWFYQAYHLALNPADKPLAVAAIAICLRLDPGNREAEALRQRLASSR